MRNRICSMAKTLLVIGAVVGSTNALAATTDSALEKCSDPRVDRTACLREAAAAQDAKQRGQLDSPGGYDANALKRCNRQPEGTARDACVKRVTGAGNTNVTGSVKGGGKLRTTEMPVPAPSPSK
jgi:hypothetical protein